MEKGKNQNTLINLDRVVKAYEEYKGIDKFAHVASYDEIRGNDFNLNISRYVDTLEEEDPVDLDAVRKEIRRIEGELTEVRGKLDRYLEELGV